MSFLGEIKRRKIFQVAAVYAVVTWLLVQIVATVEAPLNLPDWFDTAVIVLLLVGFPITLVLSWAFNVTPEGLVRDRGTGSQTSGQMIEYALIGLLIAAVGFLFVREYMPGDSVDVISPAAQIRLQRAISDQPKVAVLPCENLSANPDDAYFAASIHQEILTQLAKLSGLLVAPRLSVLAYADSPASAADVARVLNAQAVLECTVRHAGNNIVVTTTLIDPETETTVFVEPSSANLGDLNQLFAVQADIAMQVANALRVEFSLEDRQNLEASPTNSPEALALYWKALDTEDSATAHRLLNEAVRLDPQFALAHALQAWRHVGDLTNAIGNSATGEWRELERLAIDSATRALRIDPNIGRAYDALGQLNRYLWRWDQATKNYDKALEMAPNDVTILWGHAWHSAFRGDYKRAIQLAEREVPLAPNVARPYIDVGMTNFYAGNLEAALESYRRAVEVDPSGGVPQLHIGLIEARLGNVDGAAKQFRFIEQFFQGEIPLVLLPELAIGYERIGRSADAERVANQIFSIAGQREVGAGTLALAYLAIGERDSTIAQLERAAGRVANNEPDQGFFSLMIIRHNIIAHPMLDEQRFSEIRSRLGGS